MLKMQIESLFIFSLAKLTGKSKIYRELIKRRLSTADRLNVGCGINFVENWINIGLFDIPGGIYSLSKTKNQTLIIHFDMTQEFPINPNKIRYIFAAHFIEHLNFSQGINFLRNCYKVMRKNGIIRLNFPDLELWSKKYYENDLSFFKKYYDFSKNISGLPELRTKGEIFMSQVHWWDHKWCYDFDSIKDILERAGFSNIARKKVFESSLPDIKKLESDAPDRILETIYVEAEKLH